LARVPGTRTRKGAALPGRGAGVRDHLGVLAYPIAAVVYRDADLPAWLWLPTFTISAIAVSFVLAWLRLKTGSLWPGVFLHASHNLWMQSVFTPLTAEKEHTKWVAGDLGVGLVVVATIVAVVFWLKRGELKR
jgi:membrane protease YdiL (CAAX protease family)